MIYLIYTTKPRKKERSGYAKSLNGRRLWPPVKDRWVSMRMKDYGTEKSFCNIILNNSQDKNKENSQHV